VLGETIRLVEPTEALTWRAVGLRARHCRRRGSELSLADCVALATGRHGDRLATADPPLARAAASELIALPSPADERPLG